MNHLKIALLQIAPTSSLAGNLNKGMKYCRMAKDFDMAIGNVKASAHLYRIGGKVIPTRVTSTKRREQYYG